MQATKQKKWWRRPLNTFLSTVLIASSLSFAVVPSKVKASSSQAVGPGGVEGAALWLRADQDITVSNGTVSAWNDQSGNDRHFYQGNVTNQPSYNDETDRLNFNQVVSFDGNNDYLANMSGVLGNEEHGHLDIFTVAGIKAAGATSLFWERTGNTAGGSGPRIQVHPLNTWDAGNFSASSNRVTGAVNPLNKYFVSNFNFEYISPTENSQKINRNGELFTGTENLPGREIIKGIGKPLYLGAGYGPTEDFLPSGYLSGQMGEFIVYTKSLTSTDRQKIDSYLAIKYGQSLNMINYLNANGDIVWQADANYNHNIAGIARDDNGGLYQKQSRATEDASKFTISIGTALAAKNELVNGVLNDKQALIWGDNGSDLKFTKQIGSTSQYSTERIWRVQNTGNVGTVTIGIPTSEVVEGTQLLVGNSETDFTNATAYAMEVKEFEGIDYYVTSAQLDGQYFTFASVAPIVESVSIEEITTNQNHITVIFDKEIQLTEPKESGFTILIDNQPIMLTSTDFKVDPTNDKKLLITLPENTDITGKSVKVEYSGQGNLKGTNGVLVTEFSKEITPELTLEVTVTSPTGTVNTSKPKITGTATPDSKVTITYKDKEGTDVTQTIDVGSDGKWSHTPDTDLKEGGTIISVTVEKDGETVGPVTKTVTVDTTPNLTVDVTSPTGTVNTSKPEITGTATPDSKVTITYKDKEGTDVTQTIDVGSDGKWSHTPDTDLKEGGTIISVTVEKDGETVGPVTKTVTVNTTTPPVLTPGLGSLIPSTGALSPSFSSEVTNYTMYVDYATSQLSFLATPSHPSASVTMTVNGQAVTNGIVPLAIGANTVAVTVQDGTGFKQYTITVYRANDNSSGGGTWTPDPTPPTTNPGTTTTKIKVELEIDGDNPLEKTAVEIERTKHANGEITDFVVITEENVKEAVEKAKQIGNNIARIVIPDVNDEVDKVTVEIPKQSLQTLRENGLSLEISTENGHIAIPQSSMEGIDDSFYFRLVPVKKESERQAIEERAKVEQVVRETLQSNDVSVIARPMTIETNMPSRPVQVTLPLKGVNVPTSSAERQAFLAQLAVFIEHSDGEKKVVFPEVVTMAKGELGLRFTVEKFSTFTIIQFEKPEVSEHEAYIKGFPNGTFGPDKNVTRAQVAIMMARILGYTEGQTVNEAPFKDVAKDYSAVGAIAFVKEQGIMNGDNKGSFQANANITRAEMAAVVANFKQLSVEEGAAITFKDTKDHWAQWIIEANRAAGIINGLEDGSFAPNAALTRAQAVVMMNRMFERGPLHGVTKPSFPDVKAKHWAFKEIEEAANSHSYIIDEDGKEQLSK